MDRIREKKRFVGNNLLGLSPEGARRAIVAQRLDFFLSRIFILPGEGGELMHDFCLSLPCTQNPYFITREPDNIFSLATPLPPTTLAKKDLCFITPAEESKNI